MNLIKVKNLRTTNRLSVILILFCVNFFLPKYGCGQSTVLVSQGGSVAVNNGDLFYDAGGLAGNDGTGSGIYTITLTPAVAGESVCVDFTSFVCADKLDIYDGINTSATNIGTLVGNYGVGYNASGTPNNTGQDAVGTLPGVYAPGMFCATNATGALTFKFTNTNSNNVGWVGNITTFVKSAVGCNIEITANPGTVCSGTPTTLTASGSVVSPSINTDFNNSAVGAGWYTTPGTISFLNVLSCEPNNGYPTRNTDNSIYVWMQSVAAPRILESAAFDVTGGGWISFDFRYASDDDGGNGCEGPDNKEGVYVQYSTNGGTTWNTFKLMFPGEESGGTMGVGGYVYYWNKQVLPIPVGAKTANTKFRWIQQQSTSGSEDSWGLDNVMISTQKALTITIYDQAAPATILATSTTSPLTLSVSPTANTTYVAKITDGTSTCTDTITVNTIYCGCVPPSINTQPTPQTVCAGANTSFIVAATGASGYQWQVNTGSGWANVANGGVYSGATTATLVITGITSGMSTYQYRCNVLESVGTCPVVSTAVALTMNPIVSINYAGSPYPMTLTAAQSVTVTGGAVTGSYTSTPTGLALNATTGAITPNSSNPGTYVVSVPSACGPLTDTIVILVNCQDYQIQMYSDGSLGSPITKTLFGCADAPVTLGPQVMPDTGDFNGGLPYTDLLIVVTATSGDLSNLSMYRYNFSGVKVETLTVYSSGRMNNYFLRPTGCKYSIDKTNTASGTYTYEIKDAITGALLTSGTWTVTAGAESAQSALVFPTGTGIYSGAGVTNGFDPSGTDDYTDDRGIGYFDPATAGTGVHHIVYTWNNNLPAPNNCIQTDTITVTVTGPSAPAVADKNICYGTSTTLTASSGTVYKWYSAATGGTAIFTGATYTTPSLTATTNYWISNTTGGCESPRTMVTVSINPLPTVSVSSPTVCAGQPANIVAIPGVAGTYSYAWTVPAGASAPGNVTNFNASVAGTYSVVITNTTTTCTSASASGTVSFNPLPSVTVNSPTVCAGQSANVVATPGTAANYSFVWTVPSGATNPGSVANFNATIAGTYSVIITNSTTTCVSASGSGVVTLNPISAVSVNSPTACAGQPASVIATPGTASTYSYAWTVPSGATNPGDIANFDATVGGNYSVIITNSTTTCVSASSMGVVTINPLPTVTINSPSICAGQNANVIATPGTPGTYSYAWTVPVGATDPGSVSAFEATIGGIYSVVITNPVTSCVSASGSGVVSLNPLPIIQITSDVPSGCEPLAVTFLVNSTPQAQSATWSFGNGATSTSLTPATLYLNDGVFDVSINVTDVNGCSNSLPEDDFITVYPKPVVDFTFSPTTGMVNEAMIFTSNYNQYPATWMWSFGDGNEQSNALPTVNYAYTLTNNYTVTHIVETEFGCRDTISKPLTVITRIVVPNVLTPNNDGFNDTFKIDGLQFVEGAEMKIYNRWGKLVYESNSYKNDWDGENHADGVYFYVLTLPEYLQTGPFSGSVSLFR